MAHDFIDRRKTNWKRLEEMLSLAVRGQLRLLHRDQVREFGRLYQRTAADYAIARQEIRDGRLVNYLNNLVGRAHGAVYQSDNSGFRGFWEFYRYRGPALLRETFRYTLAAFLVFMAFGCVSGYYVYHDDEFADRIAPGVVDQVKSGSNWTDNLNENNPAGSAFVTTNNLQVAAFAFAGGVLLGLGTLFSMALNGLHIGGVTALCIKYKFAPVLIFMCGHGVFELTAIFISGGAGFLMGGALLVPGNLTRGEALIQRSIQAVQLMLIVLPLLLFAGIIEGFISPAHIHPGYKLAVSGTTAILLILYVLTPDRRSQRKSKG